QPFGAARVVDDGLLPPLRVADEDLGRLRAARRGLGDRVAAVNVCTDQWPRRHGLELRCTHRHSPTTTDVAPAGARWRGRTGTAPLIGLATMTRILSALAWPYANGPRHIGHVAGFGVPADVFSRYMRMAGHDVLMVSGTDEHGTPILVAADAAGVSAKELADTNNRLIVEDLAALG